MEVVIAGLLVLLNIQVFALMRYVVVGLKNQKKLGELQGTSYRQIANELSGISGKMGGNVEDTPWSG